MPAGDNATFCARQFYGRRIILKLPLRQHKIAGNMPEIVGKVPEDGIDSAMKRLGKNGK
jgi:hypothetical protein